MTNPGSKIDPFSTRRLQKFVDDHRETTGQLPTLRDFAGAGFHERMIKQAVREKLLVELYVTLTNGTIVKGYKRKS